MEAMIAKDSWTRVQYVAPWSEGLASEASLWATRFT